MKRSLSLFMAAVMLLLLPANILASGVSGAQNEPTRVRQLEELRESNSDTYLLSDGSYECVVYAADKYYKDDSGKYVEIDHSIVKSPVMRSGKNYQYKNAAGAVTIGFAQNEPSVFVESEGDSISFSLAASNRTQANTSSSMTARSISGFSLNGENYLEYRNVLPQTDFVYAVQNHGVKEYIILNSPEAPTEFSFNFSAKGYTPEKTEYGTVEFKDESGEAVFELGALFAVDSAGAYTEELEYSIIESARSKYEITIALSREYAKDEARVFPLVVSLTADVYGASKTDDCYISSKYPTTCFGSSLYTVVGYKEQEGLCRTLLKFNLPSYINPDHVLSSNIMLKRFGGGTPSIKVFNVTRNWNERTATWNNQPSYESVSGVSVTSNASEYKIVLTAELVKTWMENNQEKNYGMMLMMYENSTSQWAQFYSSETSAVPLLKIFYKEGQFLTRGYETNNISICRLDYDGGTWKNAIQKSLNNWNSSKANVTFNMTFQNSFNFIIKGSYDYGAYGYMYSTLYDGAKLKRFRIELNSKTIERDAKPGKLENFIQSVLVHELGHTIWLADNPSTQRDSIMKYTRDRNTMTKPSTYDVDNVKSKY